MRKVWWVARREFIATVATKGFVIGVLIMPASIAALVFVLPHLVDDSAPRIEGAVAVADPTGRVEPLLAHELAPETMAARRLEIDDRVRETMDRTLPGGTAGMGGDAVMDQALAAVMGETPLLSLAAVPGADVAAWKQRLGDPTARDDLLAVIVVHDDAIPADDTADARDLGSYDMFVPPKLDDRLQRELRGALRRAIVEARIRASGLDPAQVAALTSVGGASTRVVSEQGERASNRVLNVIIPGAFMGLLLMSVMSTGSQLMSSTVEDKSSRVVELLLAAASPLELMTGKILAQMAVGFVMLGLYAAMGLATLASFAVLDLIDPSLLFYLLLFYVLSYVFMAGVMGAIGAAVNDASEASTMLAPVMVVMMIPWLLWLPISRNPDGMLSIVLSFVPPVNLYAVLLRMTSSSPPPSWQVWLSIALSVMAAAAALWFAAKVFRIGLLMHGKPPDFRTLVRWIRLA
jgi:ABC-type Na+ efflux pump permease subunit